MASTHDMQEELQKSVVLSEEDAEFEEDDMGDAMVVDDAAAADPNQSSNSSLSSNQVVSQSDGLAEGEIQSEKSIDRGNDQYGDDEGHDEPEEEDPADQDDDSEEEEDSDSQGGDAHDEDGEFEEDAEGEDDDMGAEIPPTEQNGVLSGGEEDDEENEEVVGAVKIKPGETDDEDESEIDDDISSASSVSSRESAAEWEEEAAENEDDDDEEDEESEVADSNACVFCKKDEENDPGEDFELFLSCRSCGEHAHQQCARDADALNEKNRAGNWKCPDCAGDDSDSESDAESVHEEAEVNGEIEDGDVSPASTRRSTASKLARDLLPSQRGVNKPDSHSVFNQLVLDEDPMDGSRVLRKRKTSSAEAEINEEVMSLRKRRKNTNDDSNQDEAVQEKPNEADEGVRPRSSRSLRLKISNPAALCIVMEKSSKKLILKMRVPAAELRQILSQKPKTRKRSNRATTSRSARSTARARRTATAEPPPLPPMAPFSSSSYTQPFYSFYDKETDELKGKPYGGILTEAEADTSKTLPAKDDRRRFDEAKQKADEEWRNRLLEMQAEIEAPAKKSKKSSGPASQIECIEFGGWEIDTWYAAPYPEEYSRNRVLYICEFCLKYMNSDYVAWRHKLKCSIKHPPGDEIYRQGSISFFEVDGRKNPVYCQNLCLLAKLFLGSKTLYYDVEPFLFYVLCEYDDLGYHFVGYFSKEKRASSQNNVSCILTLPIHQRKGYGNLLIDFSYLLTRVEEKTGSPEKPLSDMGLVSYRNYWRLVMCKYLLEHTPTDKLQKKGMSIRQMSDDTGMMPDDVISALEGLRCLVRDPVTQQYAFRVDLPFCREYVAKWEAKNYVQLNEKSLTWTPYVMGRSNATNFELGPALNAIAPRDEDEDNKAVQILAESGIATGDFAVTNDARQKVLAGDSTILESTEPNENAAVTSNEETKINGIDKENDQPAEETKAQDSGENQPPTISTEDAWMTSYKDIPPVRFEVFPPINLKRPGASRVNSTISRPVPSRPPVTVPRPRPKRPAGSGVRKAAARPKSTAARRKTGGTGRGPGRWPKGTKKEDYGGASSGPGLPPGWIKKQADADAEKAAKPGAADNETKDTVEVKQSRSRKSSNRGTDSDTISARFALKEKGSSSSLGSNAGSGSGDGKANNSGNAVKGEGGDEDAEGEDE